MGNPAEDRAKAATLPEGDVIRVLLEQHARIRDLFAEVQRSTGDHKKEVFDELRALLAVHETAEEMVLRPVSEKVAGQSVADARNAEETEANKVLAELEDLDVNDPNFDTRIASFKQAVNEHAEAEEKDEFPAILGGCEEDERHTMGSRVLAAEKVAPTHPHPSTAGSTAKQMTVGPFASIVDRVKDAIKSAG